eukprot:2056715-Pleurochrysis_carterae.AAC.8
MERRSARSNMPSVGILQKESIPFDRLNVHSLNLRKKTPHACVGFRRASATSFVFWTLWRELSLERICTIGRNQLPIGRDLYVRAPLDLSSPLKRRLHRTRAASLSLSAWSCARLSMLAGRRTDSIQRPQRVVLGKADHWLCLSPGTESAPARCML